MAPLNRNQAIWLARGAALGSLWLHLLRALRGLGPAARQQSWPHEAAPEAVAASRSSIEAIPLASGSRAGRTPSC